MSCFWYKLEWIQGYSYNNVIFTHSHVFLSRRERGGATASLLIIVPSVKEKRLRRDQQILRCISGPWIIHDEGRDACLHGEFINCVWGGRELVYIFMINKMLQDQSNSYLLPYWRLTVIKMVKVNCDKDGSVENTWCYVKREKRQCLKLHICYKSIKSQCKTGRKTSWEIRFIMRGCRGWGWQAAGTWVLVSVKS